MAATKRDFLKILTVSTGAVAAGAIAWPLIDALNPTRQSLATARPIVNVGGIAENTAIRIVWLDQPIYIRKLTTQQIDDNEFVVPSTLPDPATYTDRVKPGYETFVVVVGLNTGIPCELEGNDPLRPPRPVSMAGSARAMAACTTRWAGSAAGQQRKNLAIPRFTFLNDTQIQFG